MAQLTAQQQLDAAIQAINSGEARLENRIVGAGDESFGSWETVLVGKDGTVFNDVIARDLGNGQVKLSTSAPASYGSNSFIGITTSINPSTGTLNPLASQNQVTVGKTESSGGGLWTGLRDAVEAAGVLAGNYVAPGSSFLTSNLVSEGAKQQLSSPELQLANIATGLTGGLSGNLSAGTQAGQAVGLTGPTASALGNTALVGATTGDLEKAALSGALSATGSTVGSNVTGATDSQALGQLAGGTAVGLLSGQDLGSALGNAAINTGVNQAAGGLLNTFNTPSSNADYSTGANYDLTQGQDIGGLGLKANLGSFDPSNPYSFNVNYGNQDSMGGGAGLQIPTETGATLGSIGTEVDANNATSTGSSTSNPATQNLLAKLLLTGLTGTTGTNNMATTDNNNLLGSLLGGALSGAGGLMQSNTNQAAYQAQADALRQAGQTAASQAQFRPVGTTTTFGTSNFQVDPTTGQLTSAGYSLSPQLQAYQNQIMGAGQQSLNDAAALQNLGRGYIAQSPEAAAQQWLSKQQALLQPSRDVESARLANQLQQTGRTGVSVAQGGGLSAANPEMQALANARAMQDLQLAAQAQQQGQAQTQFGQGLLSSAYQPFTAGLNTAAGVEQLGQQPFTMSQGLGTAASTAGANAGRLGLAGNISAADSMLKANQINSSATLLNNLGKSNLFNSAVGNLFGNTSVGSSLGSWLGSLAPSFSDTTGWSNGGNGVVTLNDGTTVNLADYFNTPLSNSGGYDNLSF